MSDSLAAQAEALAQQFLEKYLGHSPADAEAMLTADVLAALRRVQAETPPQQSAARDTNRMEHDAWHPRCQCVDCYNERISR